jgi:DNA mismatch repair ATPase MutS
MYSQTVLAVEEYKQSPVCPLSTHDLALADIGGSLNGQLYNVHFQEEFENGKMLFDYKLREGVVTKSNGLALMRSIGLDV